MFGKQKFVYCIYCEPMMFGSQNASIPWENSGFVIRNNFLANYSCKNIKMANKLKRQLEKYYPNYQFIIRKFYFDEIRGCFTACLTV